jgi:hypothetical protein
MLDTCHIESIDPAVAMVVPTVVKVPSRKRRVAKPRRTNCPERPPKRSRVTLPASSNAMLENKCVVCLQNKKGFAYLPCGYWCMCEQYSENELYCHRCCLYGSDVNQVKQFLISR